MAGAGKKTWTAGDVLTASDVNTYLMDQAVMNFAGTAARSSAIPSPSEGMVSHVGGGTVQVYDGADWVDLGGAIGAAVISSPAATGSYSSGGTTYNYYKFTASGTLTVDDAGDGSGGFADVLVIAGGGGGGCNTGGGGGGGGFIEYENVYLPSGSLTVTVGGGGSGGLTSPRTSGTNGNDSYIVDPPLIIAVGGGGGGTYQASGYGRDPQTGGSGGGSHRNVTNNSTAVTGQGNVGGVGPSTAAGGGGGGAGAAGSSSSGGAGANSSYDANSATTYAAGGDAGSASAGGANTGDGGNGLTSTTLPGSNGGSGIVIVRVAV